MVGGSAPSAPHRAVAIVRLLFEGPRIGKLNRLAYLQPCRVHSWIGTGNGSPFGTISIQPCGDTTQCITALNGVSAGRGCSALDWRVCGPRGRGALVAACFRWGRLA